MGERSAAYCRYYDRQYGGEIPVYRGGQHGDGLGDILRGILRFIAPIALRGISSFATSTVQAHARGASLSDAAKGAWRPALGAMVSAAQNKMQTGSGVLFQGTHGIPFERAVTYKRHAVKKRKGTSKKATSKKGSTTKRSRLDHINYNY